MSRRYFFNRVTDLPTHKLIEIISDIDNGVFDKTLDIKDWFEKMDVFREEIIEVLLRRYRSHYVFNEDKDPDLDKAFNLYLKHYL